MEMPEGYKKLRAIRFENADEVELLVCLNLMREMAEALDEMVRACNQGYGRDIQQMERAINNFKEWK